MAIWIGRSPIGCLAVMTEDTFSGASVEFIRRQNLAAALRMLHIAGPSSRSQLAAATGLNRSTVADLVVDLRRRGLVSERRSASRGLPGRPSPMVEVEPEGAVVLAIQIFPDWSESRGSVWEGPFLPVSSSTGAWPLGRPNR